MSKLPIGTTVVSKHGQVGVVVPSTSPMWPTLTAVRWVGTSFQTHEDSRNLRVVESSDVFVETSVGSCQPSGLVTS